MGSSERHAYFERLVAMRDGYATSGGDRGAVLAIDDAVRYVVTIVTAVEHDDEPWHAEVEEMVADEAHEDAPHTPHPPPHRPSQPHPHLVRFASDLWPWPARSPRSTRSFGRDARTFGRHEGSFTRHEGIGDG